MTTDYSLRGKKVWVTGHHGMVGSAVVRRLASEECEIVTVDRRNLDLCRQDPVEQWLSRNRPDVVVMAAAKVGGILANSTYPADFIRQNLAIETNVIHAAHLAGVEKLLFVGSSCIYPRLAPQPIVEDSLLAGPLEPTNEWYAIAKIAGVKLSAAYRRQYGRDFISAMPTNLFGPGDNFDVENGHVVAGLIVKAHRAKVAGDETMEVWGTGKPLREFLYVGDLADALVFLLKHYSGEMQINVGTGIEYTTRELAEIVARVVGFRGGLHFDASKPDGHPRKLMDSSRIHALGWKAQTPIETGLREAYESYLGSGAA